jgi:3-oxoadipate enol-lactonase
VLRFDLLWVSEGANTLPSISIRDLGGVGTPVVVLNGSGCPLDHMMPLAKALSPRYRVLLPVFPGYDGVPPVSVPYTMSLERRLVEDALLAKGVDAAAVIGFSLGGYRALSLATSSRLRVTELVVLGGFASVSAPDKLLYRELATMVRNETITGAALVGRFLSPAFAAAHPDRCQEIATWLSQIDKAALATELEAVAESEDLEPLLGAITARTLARVGALDLAAPPAASEIIAKRIPYATLEVVEGSGHLLLFEDYDATLASVIRALARSTG